jgi:hypothetical protein
MEAAAVVDTLTEPSGAPKQFGPYWYLLVGWSGNLLLHMLLEAVKRRAERA